MPVLYLTYLMQALLNPTCLLDSVYSSVIIIITVKQINFQFFQTTCARTASSAVWRQVPVGNSVIDETCRLRPPAAAALLEEMVAVL